MRWSPFVLPIPSHGRGQNCHWIFRSLLPPTITWVQISPERWQLRGWGVRGFMSKLMPPIQHFLSRPGTSRVQSATYYAPKLLPCDESAIGSLIPSFIPQIFNKYLWQACPAVRENEDSGKAVFISTSPSPPYRSPLLPFISPLLVPRLLFRIQSSLSSSIAEVSE